MVSNVSRNIPVTFQTIETVDSRFTKVKIWLMHTGENLNGSYFSKESVASAIPTLANTPILGYLEEGKEGDLDYSDHRSVLAKEDGRWTLKYIGQAFGVIPENSNPQFETKLCDDGVEREFLTCEGLLWNKWDDPIDVLQRDGNKAQSMEIHEDYSGEFDTEGKFHFKKFKFFGACILGTSVEPAMTGADVSVSFSQDSIFQGINEKMEEYKLLVASKFANQGGENMENDEKEPEIPVEIPEAPAEAPVVEPAPPAPVEEAPAEAPAEEPAPAEVFSITAQQVAQAIRDELCEEGGSTVDQYGWESDNFCYVDHTDSMVIAYRTADGDLVGFTYTMNGDIPEIDFESGIELRVDFVPVQGTDPDEANDASGVPSAFVVKAKLNFEVAKAKREATAEFASVTGELEEVKNSFAALEIEVNELREFKKASLDAERKSKLDELFERFSQLTDEELASLKADAYGSDMTLDFVETNLFALVGKKTAKFSTTTPKSKSLKIDLAPVGASTNEPVYADLIRTYGNKKK